MSVEECRTPLLKFTPFISCVDPGFWHKLSNTKLEVDRIEEKEHIIWGYYSNKKQEGLNQVFYVDGSSFNEEPDENRLFGCGKIINKNTIERYKDIDKLDLLRKDGIRAMEIIKRDAIENPSLLNMFTVISFADLKQYLFYYKFLFLAPSFISYNLLGKTRLLKHELDDINIMKIANGYNALTPCNKGFFLIDLSENDPKVVSIKDGLPRVNNFRSWIFGFADSCEYENPGWPLRNFLAFISYHCNNMTEAPVKVLGLRLQLINGNWNANDSILFDVIVNINEGTWERGLEAEDWVGWERNEKGHVTTKTANLKTLLDPIKMAEASVDLNLKLIKWQLVPEIDLDIIKNTKCLILGAGTLGCGVARNLLGWGVHKITFVDCGTVSYSNPVRQSLFKLKDYGLPKAKVAAEALKEIHPNVDAQGVQLFIPMPGHPIGESLKSETMKNLQIFDDLVEEHDAIFLLMDSRESRWLPTLLGAAKKKLVIDTALGFESFMVMRHGIKTDDPPRYREANVLNGWNLGCYFCNDVTAPGNTNTLRTLDKQCTVTRPGLASIACGLAVELFVSVLQHPLQGLAVAESDPDADTDGLLGIIPHSIRGFLNQYLFVAPASVVFDCCVACSSKVINEYKKKGLEFILRAVESKEYLEEVSGLTDLLHESKVSDDKLGSDFSSDSDN